MTAFAVGYEVGLGAEVVVGYVVVFAVVFVVVFAVVLAVGSELGPGVEVDVGYEVEVGVGLGIRPGTVAPGAGAATRMYSGTSSDVAWQRTAPYGPYSSIATATARIEPALGGPGIGHE